LLTAVSIAALLCVAIWALFYAQHSASRAEKASVTASEIKRDADKATADRAALDQAASDKAAADAHDKQLAETAANKALAAKAAADKAVVDKKAARKPEGHAGQRTQCDRMKAAGLRYSVALTAWWSANSPPSWDVDHDGWPCERAYGEQA
jgi:FtsZ-interacting cell division protein ZipA